MRYDSLGGWRRRATATLTIFMTMALAIIATPGVAMADSSYLYKGPSGSYGYAEWYTTSDGLRLLSNPTTIASGYCLDVWFDWDRDGFGGHYDARVARSCKALNLRESGWNYETSGVDETIKLATCYGLNNATTSPLSNCNQHADSDSVESVLPNLPNMCTRSWRLTSGGSYFYDDGGSSTSCSFVI